MKIATNAKLCQEKGSSRFTGAIRVALTKHLYQE